MEPCAVTAMQRPWRGRSAPQAPGSHEAFPQPPGRRVGSQVRGKALPRDRRASVHPSSTHSTCDRQGEAAGLFAEAGRAWRHILIVHDLGKQKEASLLGLWKVFFFKLPIKTSEDGELPKRDNNP